MEEDTTQTEDTKIFCCKLPRRTKMVWQSIVMPSILSFILYTASIVVDTAVACQLAFADDRLQTGISTFTLIYVPVIFSLALKPPQPPETPAFAVVASWALQLMGYTIISPILISKRLLKRFIWTVTAVRAKKPHEEILQGYEAFLPKEIYSYLFLQAFLQCAPQIIVQMHLLILGVSTNRFTEYLQGVSVLVGVMCMASCTASFHRYEAQVVAGRPTVLLLSPPEPTTSTSSDTSTPLLPIRFCLHSKVIGLEMDSPSGKVVLFFSWFLLIFGRFLCLVISNEIHPNITVVILSIHMSIILLYLFSSQTTTLYEVPSRLTNAVMSVVTLIEVSVRYHKIPMLYTVYFICIFVQDTYLMILFFVYRSYKCSSGSLDCIYAYLIMNSHVIGIILFGIYLAKFRPRRKFLTASSSTTSIVTN